MGEHDTFRVSCGPRSVNQSTAFSFFKSNTWENVHFRLKGVNLSFGYGLHKGLPVQYLIWFLAPPGIGLIVDHDDFFQIWQLVPYLHIFF